MNLKDTNASVLEVKIEVVSYHIQLDTHTHIQVCMHGCTHAHTHQVPWDGISAIQEGEILDAALRHRGPRSLAQS